MCVWGGGLFGLPIWFWFPKLGLSFLSELTQVFLKAFWFPPLFYT